MIARTLPLWAAAAVLLGDGATGAQERGRTAVLEYRAGVDRAADLGDRLAQRLKKLAALDVVDGAEARRRMARVDAEVAACGGDTGCTGRLAATLDTDEVLLVAVSQLGDLVLALQRIDAAGKISAQFSAVIKSDAELTEEQLDAWLHQLYPPVTFKRYGFISIVVDTVGANVQVNDDDHGETPLDGKIKLPAPRAYRVALRKKGRVPFAASIDLLPDTTVEVRAQLPPLEGPTPWYKRWYVWAAVGGVVAGTAIGTAIYLTLPDQNHSNGQVTGLH